MGLDDKIEGSWQRIEEWLRTNHPDKADMLAPGARDEDLAALEEGLGFPVPDELRASWRAHDGQVEVGGGPVPIFYLSAWLSISEALQQWRLIQEVTSQWGPEQNWALDPVEGVQNRHWDRGWIPITHNGGGDCFCVDTNPATGGTYGQVIFVDHEVGPQHIAASGVEEWLGEFAQALEAGAMYIWKDGSMCDEPDPEED